MQKISLHPYLFFGGNCREAMEFYKSIFDGELSVQTNGEVNPNSSDEEKDQVIHAKLEGEIELMASDMQDPNSSGTGRISLSLSGGDDATLRRYFEQLGAGGKVNAPLKTEFWGDTFGMLTDKFGIDWMINIVAEKVGSV